MSSDREVLDNDSLDSLASLPKAVSLMDSHSNPIQQSSTIAHAPAFDQVSDKLFKSIQQCIDSALKPLVQRMADIEKAMVIRTASIAEQVSTVSLNQQILHQNLIDIMEKVDQLQFEEQSVYTDKESMSSFDIPAKRSTRNADNASVCSTEASEYLSNSDEGDGDDDSVCTETAEILNQFHIPEAVSINAERYNQFTRIESRKYTARFSNANQATLSTDQTNITHTSNNDKPMEQTEQTGPKPLQIIPGIPVVPLTTAANAASAKPIMSTSRPMSANTPISSVAPINQAIVSLPPTVPVAKKTQPITIAPITVSIPTPNSAVPATESPSLTTSVGASSEPTPPLADPAPAPSSVTVSQVKIEGNRSRSNQRQNRREPIGKKFEYVYFEYVIRSRAKCKDIRTELTGIGIQSKKLLDVYFPGKRVAAALFPDNYLDEAIDMLQKNNFTILTNFSPLDSKNLGDPKYKNLSNEERNEILRNFHEKQMCRAIDRVRYPAKSYVYEDFYKKGWISKETYTNYLLDIFRP
ncbi:40S ribosomal protein S4 [Mucor velutinosus]|uniref:40S ribosomal protein S4 n=1 Tax=Mucor velutinosus TaxID=708070 RepID=A0AAN7DJ90_9FUNG|nr:40S ribosomal protein S4 [Mucor velutinosus]